MGDTGTKSAAGTQGTQTLERLLQEYETDSATARRSLREWFGRDRDHFLAAAVPLMKGGAASRAFRYLVALLTTNGCAAEVLCSPALSVPDAVAVTSIAMQVDPMLDVTLARRIAEGKTPHGERGAERLLAILGEVTEGSRILAPLSQALRHPSAHVRSKAALLIGRITRNPQWVQRALGEADPRVRANAVEALWGVESVGVRDVLRAASQDANNRVAGNALAALFRLGDCAVLQEIVRMGSHPAPAFRATAAWVMGETGDPRFTPVLARMMAELDPMVRHRAFISLGRLRSANAGTQRLRDLSVSVGPAELLPDGSRHVRVGVSAPPPDPAPRLLPTQFVLTEDGEPIYSYGFDLLPLPESVALVLLLPSNGTMAVPWQAGAQACIVRKRSADAWAIVQYDDLMQDGAEALQPPAFSADAAEVLQARGSGPRCGFWNGLRRAVAPCGGAGRGSRHVLVFNAGPREPIPDLANLAATARTYRATIHVVSTAPCPPLEQFCAEANGGFRLIQEGEPPVLAVERACLHVLAQYSLTWLPGTHASNLRVEIRSPEGWGEDTIRL